MNSGRQTVAMNSGRPIGVVQEGSSNSDHEQWSSNSAMNSGRPIGVVQEGSSNSGHEQWSSTVVVQEGSSMNSVVKQGSSNLTAHDLQLRRVISPSFELRFGCSWTLWKAH